MKLCTSIASCVLLASGFLLSIPACGHAGGIGAQLSIDVTVTPSGAGYDWDYRVTLLNPPADGAAIGAIEIPEVQLGYLDWTIFTLPTGWLGTEITSPAFGDPLIKPNGVPAGWILLQTLDYADSVTSGNSPLDFNLYSTFGGGPPAQVIAALPVVEDQISYEDLVTVDPRTPSPVPEPSTWALMGLGALGLIALRRRKALFAPARA